MKYIVAIILVLFFGKSFSQNLETSIENILRDKKAQVGVSIFHLESGEKINHHGDKFYAMQSVFKYPIALVVLDKMQKENIPLNHTLLVTKADLLENTWSPLRDKYPNGNSAVTMDELLSVMVSRSDNNACDILLRWIGGPDVAEQYFENLGIENLKIVADEETMGSDWNIQYLNYSSPNDMNNLLQKSFTQPLLANDYQSFLWKIMKETSTGLNRIKGLLPKNTVVYHKTGTSAVTSYGLAGALNDVGIIELPNKKHLAISIFVNNSLENEETNDKIIAEISKAAFDYFLTK
ncbi:class A beta-lactamase, subclass A2 [Sphingobacterium hungaricum]|uniref:Beta-lactamase n=1 Tax=Sphingobacterium hungaricum TaxID=2082723 RepID=A0A928YSY6_9SPHI|nr:class A beta-lactamase, subclass A2 [Sphingobacterium hungaricum]MBE8714733.1 hypothetical protein [Sphingobacterium hungaricum]